jgi:DNA modification methylase
MEYKVVDYSETYGSIMQFGKNKSVYIHRWYPFVEGYSKEFILTIIDEYKKVTNNDNLVCLEPFAGSGTTPLELQKLGYECHSFEISPFMYDLACCKMETTYTIKSFDRYFEQIQNYLMKKHEYSEDEIKSHFKTLVEQEGISKWLFHKDARLGILDILHCLEEFKSKKYQRLFRVALSSILLDVSNVYRNGKCVSYKTDWKKSVNYTRTDVHNIYLQKLLNVYRIDILQMQKEKKAGRLVSNINNCYLGDCRKLISKKVVDNSVNLVITSPPYLNSRDYTDTYMVELKALGYISNLNEIKALRKKTLRSHVQIKWGEIKALQIHELTEAIEKIEKYKDKFWNKDLLNMIKGYFEDIDTLFEVLYKKMTSNGMIFFNVANSAYYNVEIKVDEIVCRIAENRGFKVQEIREARRVKTSSQQKGITNGLRESVIVVKK